MKQFIFTTIMSFSLVTVGFASKPYSFEPYVDISLGTVTKWDSQTQSMQPKGLIEITNDSEVKALRLAFVTANNGCHPSWGGYPATKQDGNYAIPIIKQLKQQHIKTVIAFGGLSGEYLAQSCQTPEALLGAYESVIDTYQPEGLDFDIENAMQANPQQLDRFYHVLKILHQHYPNLKISLTLPVLPTGLVEGMGKQVIERAAANQFVDYDVNLMVMDYGPAFNQKRMSEYAIDAAAATVKQLKAVYPALSTATLWQKIQLTPMIGLNDTLPLNFSLSDAHQLKTMAAEKGISTLSFWSLTRDHQCESQYASVSCSSIDPNTHQPNQTDDYEFSKIFNLN